MGSGFSKMKKQAKMMQKQFTKMKDNLKTFEVQGSAPNDLVTITLKGDRTMKKNFINPICIKEDDIDSLQDLIIAAYQKALKKLEDKQSSQPMYDLPLNMS